MTSTPSPVKSSSHSAAGATLSIAYLGPEIPSLSATFIYEEVLAFERRGVAILPFTVRRPASPATGQEALANRTRVLYDRPTPWLVLDGLAALRHFGRRVASAFSWLLRDMASVGLHRPTAWKLAFQWLMGARLATDLLRSGITHLHVHFAHTPTQIAMYASAFSGIPFTVMAHANDIFERGLLLPQKARRASRLVTISHYNENYLRSIGVAAEKLAVVRCGVSFDARADMPSFRRGPPYRIGCLCRLVEKKGIDDLIRALQSMRAAGWSVELDIAGDGPMQERLVALARDLQVEAHVRFLGALDHEAVAPWLRTLDVFALPCKQDSNGDMDGIPVVLMEAMSQRVPVVSTRLTGIPELVVHDETGLLAEPANPASLAAALMRMLESPELRERLSNAAVPHVEVEFGQQVNLDRLLGYFTAATEGKLERSTS